MIDLREPLSDSKLLGWRAGMRCEREGCPNLSWANLPCGDHRRAQKAVQNVKRREEGRCAEKANFTHQYLLVMLV